MSCSSGIGNPALTESTSRPRSLCSASRTLWRRSCLNSKRRAHIRLNKGLEYDAQRAKDRRRVERSMDRRQAGTVAKGYLGITRVPSGMDCVIHVRLKQYILVKRQGYVRYPRISRYALAINSLSTCRGR